MNDVDALIAAFTQESIRRVKAETALAQAQQEIARLTAEVEALRPKEEKATRVSSAGRRRRSRGTSRTRTAESCRASTAPLRTTICGTCASCKRRYAPPPPDRSRPC